MGTVLDSLLSPLHIVLILVVALLIFGPRRLPELGGAVGKTIREFQKSMQDARAQVQAATQVEDPAKTTAPTTEVAKPN